jgi:Zn-dependent protease with chaperone function
LKITQKKRYHLGITAQDFQHPADIQALETLKKAKGLDWLTKKVMELGLEKIIKMQLTADYLKVSDKQCGSLFRRFQDCCKVLDIGTLPELYVEPNPFPNAYTTGFTNPVVVVSSGLLEIVDDDELNFVLGHELAHVKCGHVLYTTMANYLAMILQVLGDVTLGIGRILGKGLELSFLLWSRKAEYSCDRGGLLVCQKPDSAIKGLMKLAAPIDKLWPEISVESILTQADEFEELSEDSLSKLYKFFYGVQRTHPWLVIRTKEIKIWENSETYTNLLERGVTLKEYSQQSKSTQQLRISKKRTKKDKDSPESPQSQYCSNCGNELQSGSKFCTNCGTKL